MTVLADLDKYNLPHPPFFVNCITMGFFSRNEINDFFYKQSTQLICIQTDEQYLILSYEMVIVRYRILISPCELSHRCVFT